VIHSLHCLLDVLDGVTRERKKEGTCTPAATRCQACFKPASLGAEGGRWLIKIILCYIAAAALVSRTHTGGVRACERACVRTYVRACVYADGAGRAGGRSEEHLIRARGGIFYRRINMQRFGPRCTPSLIDEPHLRWRRL